MNSVKPQSLIRNSNLDPTNYFRSILEEANRLGILSDFDLEKLQLQIIELFTVQIERYTSGESSSVRMEIAQNIMQSVFYTISIYLKSLPTPDAGIAVLKQEQLTELYRQGRRMIGAQIENAKRLFGEVKAYRLDTANNEYQESIENGITAFFENYDPDYAAHETPASIDYPLSLGPPQLSGIEYMCSYLQKLSWENQFCQNFTSDEVESLLRGYDDQYQYLLINIFRLLLTNLTGLVLAQKSRLHLAIETSDLEYLQAKLPELSFEHLDNLLGEVSNRICREFNVANPLMQNYIASTVLDLSPGLKDALKKGTLEAFFIFLKEKPAPSALKFQDTPKMDDEIFRGLVRELQECRYIADKITIIHREVHSLADLVDLLESDCIFDAEFSQLFHSLDDMRLALLIKKLPTYIIESKFNLTESEREWHEQIKCFLTEMELSRRKKITDLAEMITSEEDIR